MLDQNQTRLHPARAHGGQRRHLATRDGGRSALVRPGEGDLIVGWVADTEQDEAHFIATEIDEFADKGVSTPA
ncbi:MAG: hypothetical protein R2722_09980 [Tessaracoccus sp.]